MKILLVLLVAAAISTRPVRSQCDCGCDMRMPVPTPTPTPTTCQHNPVFNQPAYSAMQPSQAALTNMLPPSLLNQLYQSQPLYMSVTAPNKPCPAAPKPQQAMPQVQMPQMNHYTGFHAPAMPSHPPICVQSVYVGKRDDEQDKDKDTSEDTSCSCSSSSPKRKSSKRKPTTEEEDTQVEQPVQPEEQNARGYTSRNITPRRRANNNNGYSNGNENSNTGVPRRVRKQRRQQVLSPSLLRSLLAAQGASSCSCTCPDDLMETDMGDSFDCGCPCDNSPSIVYIR